MDLSAAHHQQLHHTFSYQESESLEAMIITTKSPPENNNNQLQPEQKKPRPPETEPQQCPRCQSTNTKFCYYNNYSLAQPRYFCKACRRYWTKGGTLRNVPVGGGCRKSAKRAAPNSPSQYLKRPHTIENTPNNNNNNPFFSANFTEFDSFLGQQSFLPDMQYGNQGGFVFQSNNFCNYDEIVAGNSNSGSVISDGQYADVKQERVENGAFWENPWQNGAFNGEGLYGNYSVLGLLNTSPALM